jgi:hypothetical protein
MPYHHYLPATYLASFSYDDNKNHRARKIFVGDKSSMGCFKSAIGKTAGINNLYALVSGDDANIIEDMWSKYETQLSNAIEKLIDGTIDAVLWTRILVPFIASLFVRTTNFDTRFENRLRGIGLENNYLEKNPDNTNNARLLELQRLLAPILGAKWIVLETTGKAPVIINDIGYAPFRHKTISDFGFAIPLNLNHILVLVPMRNREIIEVKNGHWFPIIQYSTLFPDNHIGLNNILTRNARRFIFGSEKALIQSLLQQESNPSPVPEPGELGFIDGRLAMVHEFTWHRLVSTLSKDPENESSWSFNLDFDALAAGWVPPIILPINLPEFPPALRREGNKIVLSFYDVEGFTINIKNCK